MIRLRLRRGVTENELLRDGFKECRLVNGETQFLSKCINNGSYEVQIKLGFPSNVRIQDWDDNRTCQILFKFLLKLEESGMQEKIKIRDSGRERILNVNNTLELINELNKYTDICKRLTYWWNKYLEGNLSLN